MNNELLVNDTLKEIFKSKKVYGNDNEEIRLTSGVNPKEGFFMYNLLLNKKFTRCLEIGMANGISSLYICEALKKLYDSNELAIKKDDFYLMSIDPFQKTQWKNVALNNIKKAGLSDYSFLLEKKSYEALPEILSKIKDKKLEPFDFIFIDGMHLFDYTLIDFFYSDLILKKGGVIIVDDIKHSNVKAFYNYILTNYKHFKLLKNKSENTIGVFMKIDEDKRNWDFHKSFKT